MRESETRVLENKSFIKLFNKVALENNIVEYYILDQSGSFLMLDAEAKNQVWLIVKSEEDMQSLYELASDDRKPSASVLKQLKSRKSLTYFKTKEESIAAAKHWHLVDAQPLDEKKEYYYAVVTNDKNFQIDLSQVKSYNDFIKKR